MIVERPTYDRTLLSLRNRGADVRMVELEPDGIDVAALERVLARRGAAEARPHHPQLPEPGRLHAVGGQARAAARARARRTSSRSSRTTRTSRCASRASRCRRWSRWTPTRVVYASSFSKTVCPGIRVGYLVGPDGADRADRQARDQHLHLAEHGRRRAIVNQFCRSGAIDRSIETVREALRERAQTLCDALSEQLPDARFVAPEGGYFLWVDLPDGTDVAALFDAAAARGVQFVKGTDFVLEGGESSLRLAYSGVTPAEIEEGVKRLAEAYAEVGRQVNAA